MTKMIAQAAAPASSPGFSPLILLMYALFIGGFYFLFIAPQKKKQKEHERTISALSARRHEPGHHRRRRAVLGLRPCDAVLYTGARPPNRRSSERRRDHRERSFRCNRICRSKRSEEHTSEL